MEMKRKFSVIMPLYNKAPYVRKALESIVSQTCKDWELIIVDDGSTDNSLEVVNEYSRDVLCVMCDVCKNVRVIQQKNAGVAAARNRGVAESHGEYVCFLDADDWWEPTFLEEIDRLIMEYPDAGIYASNYIYYKPSKTHVALNLPRGYMNYPKAYYEGAAMPVWTGATCMPRKVFDEMGGFPVGIKLGEDFLLWAKTALHYPVAFCEKPLAYYNNDIPATMRATRNLHAPEHHMLFNLDSIEEEIHKTSHFTHQTSHTVHHTPYTIHRDVWTRLFDKLRVSGLLDYWLSDEYHDVAAAELKKVDWSKQPKSAKALYEKPIWFLKAKRTFMRVGSYVKQKLIRLLHKK